MPPTPLSHRGLTRRETEVLAAVAERLTNAEVAARLYVSERTVESHVSALLRKLGASNRVELARLAKEADTDAARSRLPGALELLADRSTFVGRTHERERLRSLWNRAAAGRMLVGVVAGEAGIGKTRLVAELAAEVHAAGARVLLGACFDDATVPYQPFVQAIGDDLAGVADPELARRTGADVHTLARIVPEVARRTGRAVAPAIDDAVDAHSRIAAAVSGYLGRAAVSSPILVVLEDIHWGTPTTLGTIRHLARSGSDAPVLVVVTTRDTAPDADDAVRLLLGDLARLPTVEAIDLAGLSSEDVGVLLRSLGASDDADAVAVETGGNPLFVREVARAPDSHARTLDGLLGRRYALLSDDELATLDVAAVIGSEFAAGLVARVRDRSVADALPAIEGLESAGLVAAVPGRAGRFTFAHALFARARYDAIPVARRLRLHRDVASALAERVDRDEHVLPELARHACIAAPLGDPRRAVEYCVAAAALAERSLALAEAAGQYRRALDVVAAGGEPDGASTLQLTIRLGEALNGTGDPEARAILLRAAAAARAAGDTDALAEVGWAMMRYGGLREPGGDPEFVAVVEEALAAVGAARTAVRARTLAVLSEDVCFTDPDRACLLAAEANAIAEELGDPVTLGHVLLSYRMSASTPDNAEAGHPTADRLVALGRQTGHEPFLGLGLQLRAWTFRGAGDLTAADRAMEASALVMGTDVAPIYSALFTLYRSGQHLLAGDLAIAEQVADEVLALAGTGFDPTNWYGPALMTIRANQGRLGELTPLIELGVDRPALGTASRAALAMAYASASRLDDARRLLRAFADDAFAGVARNSLWLMVMAWLAETAEAVGDAEAAGVIATMLEPYAGRIAAVPATVVSPVDLGLAQVTLTSGDHARAERAAAAAVAASRRRTTPIFLGRELIRLAAARRGLGALSADVDLLVREALAVADRTGAEIIRRDASRYGFV